MISAMNTPLLYAKMNIMTNLSKSNTKHTGVIGEMADALREVPFDAVYNRSDWVKAYGKTGNIFIAWQEGRLVMHAYWTTPNYD